MKVLWIVQGKMNEVSRRIGEKEPVSGTWIEASKDLLVKVKDLELHVLCVVSKKKVDKLHNFRCDGVNYHILNVDKKALLVEKGRKYTKCLNEMILGINPDIIHVHGTEFSFSLNISEYVEKKIPICHSIQGLVSSIAENYFYADLPLNQMSLIERVPLWIQKKGYVKRGKSEKKIIQRYKYFFGRTDWDFSHVTSLNPEIKYLKVREMFRDNFVNSKPWDINNIQRFTIFYAGGARVPLKGFHQFLNALALIKESFPNVLAFVAGIMPNKKIPLFGNIGYGRYLNRLVKNKGLSDNVVFTGALSSDEMLDKFYHSHCYVLGSSIENSPNTLIEAMLVGTPSVVADVGGVNSFAIHNITSYIYRFEEFELLAYYVKKIFTNDLVAQNFSNSSRKIIREVIDGNQNDLVDAYKHVIDDFNKEYKT